MATWLPLPGRGSLIRRPVLVGHVTRLRSSGVRPGSVTTRAQTRTCQTCARTGPPRPGVVWPIRELPAFRTLPRTVRIFRAIVLPPLTATANVLVRSWQLAGLITHSRSLQSAVLEFQDVIRFHMAIASRPAAFQLTRYGDTNPLMVAAIMD